MTWTRWISSVNARLARNTTSPTASITMTDFRPWNWTLNLNQIGPGGRKFLNRTSTRCLLDVSAVYSTSSMDPSRTTFHKQALQAGVSLTRNLFPPNPPPLSAESTTSSSAAREPTPNLSIATASCTHCRLKSRSPAGSVFP